MNPGSPQPSRSQRVIRYAQSWEDPDVVCRALDVGPADDVCSVASGGENTFALLLRQPRSICAIDWSSAQLALVELKQQAILYLSHDEFIEFIGAAPSSHRKEFYRRLRQHCSVETRLFWDDRSRDLERGIIHCGTFEHYFALFRSLVLRFIHTKSEIASLFQRDDLEAQRLFYAECWNNRRWRFLFRLFFSRLLLSRIARGPAAFREVETRQIADELFRRTTRGFTDVPAKDNYFLEYILTGSWQRVEESHPYLDRLNYDLLSGQAEKLRLCRNSLDGFLQTTASQSISRYNCSDVFEYMNADEFVRTLELIKHTARANARMAFWTVFVPRMIPERFEKEVMSTTLPFELDRVNRTFFYGGFHLWEFGTGACS